MTALVVVGTATPVAAATIPVTTTEDVVDADDDEVSLREAVTTANTTPGADLVVLAENATYELANCGVDQDNALGDLDATGGDALTIDGRGATIVQTCEFYSFAPPTIPQRVMASRGAGPLTLQHLTLTGGSASSAAEIGGSGGAVWAAGDVALADVEMADNETGRCGSGAAIWSGGSVSAVDSSFSANQALGEECFSPPGGVIDAAGNVGLQGSAFADNRSPGGGAVLAGGEVIVEDSTFTGTFGGVLEAPSVSVARARIAGTTDGFLAGHETLIGTSIEVTDTVVEDNGNWRTVVGDQVTVTRSTLRRNGTATVDGAGVQGDAVTLIDSTIAANADTGVVAVDDVVAENTTIVANGGRGVFAGFDHDASVQLDHVTLVGNHHDSEAANLYVRGSVSSVGSVFARPRGPSNCLTSQLPGPSHDNVSTTSRASTCGFDRTARNHFRVVVTNHDLGPLADNGGPTPTRRPAIGGSLSVIPPAACATPAFDQRGRTRPRGTRCEAGAVEVGG